MAEARAFRNSSSCGVENKLKAIKLAARTIEKERVTVVDEVAMMDSREEKNPYKYFCFSAQVMMFPSLIGPLSSYYLE